MLFFSFNYLVFLIVVFLIYYTVSNKYKLYVLFGSSILFLGFLSLKVALFSLTFALLNYMLGILMQRYENSTSLKSKVFWLSIIIDIGVLAFFKYINFFFESINSLLLIFSIDSSLPYLSLFVPIGISYYTFQSLGYLIRIKRGNERAEKNFAKFATLLLFFPKFLSGPIERSNHFFPQVESLHNFDGKSVSQGLRLFLWGAFKKIVIANNLYGPVSIVYSDVNGYRGLPLIMVLFVQAIYIYTEFSGYTDMALGSARIFGVNLIDNFNRPFLAKSVTEFWKRWHISLSSWCNDFIYYPFILRFKKWGTRASVAGVFLTFFIIGIWHGSNWTFIVLGLLQGIAISYEFYTKRIRLEIGSKLPSFLSNTLSRIFVFIFASISLVFFFSNSVSDAWIFITHLFSDINLVFSGYALIDDKSSFLIALGFFILLFIAEIINENGTNLLSLFLKQPRWVRWTGYYICILLIYIFNSEISTFVYMKF